MSELQIGLLLVFATLVVLFSGVSIAFGLLVVSILFLLVFEGTTPVASIPDVLMGELSSFALLAVPMFIILGAVIGNSRAGSDIYESLYRWLSRLPGGLVIANILACGIFSSLCGSSPATAAAVGKVGIPEMTKRGVSSRLAAGSIAAGGTLGILIPPSITFIIYGLATETSIARLFLAGVVPGAALIVIFSAYAWFLSHKSANSAGSSVAHFTLKEKFSGLLRAGPFLLVVVLVTVAMYTGIATPSEVAALAAAMAVLLVILIYRTSIPNLAVILRSSARESTMILMIIGASAVFAYMMSYLYITQSLASWMTGLDVGKWGLVILINLFLFVVGFFLPPVSIILMSMPVLLPVLIANDIDLIWFAVVMTVNLEIGLITPPVGMNLFVIRGVAPDISPKDILLGSLPFVGLMIGFIILLCFVPELATWLPDQVMGTSR